MRGKASSLLGLVLFIPLIVFALVGCGANHGSTVGSSAPSSSVPSPVALKCGTVAFSPRGTTTDAGLAGKAGDCFWQAYQQCSPVSFVLSVSGIDTVTTHTFTLEKKNNQCVVTEAVQHRIIPRPASAPQVYTCTNVNNVAGVLHFVGCGADGTMVVPTTGK